MDSLNPWRRLTGLWALRSRRSGARAFRTTLSPEHLESRTLFDVTFPAGGGLEFQTNGQSRAATIGDWYTTASSASTDRAHYLLVQVTSDMLTAGGGTVAITVNDAESATGSGALDEVHGTPDPTRFALLTADRATVLNSTIVPSGSANGTHVDFAVNTAGTYYVQSVTGAAPISGDATADLNDDDNAYSITVSQAGGLLGQYQATFQPTAAGNRSLFFTVGPGTSSLFLRNFDLDSGTVTYTKPDGTTIAGTASGNGTWNGPAGTLDTGGDSITGLTSADAGVWKVTFSGMAIGNQAIFEPNDGNGQRIVLLDASPQSAGNFVVAGGGTRSTSVGLATYHSFTVTNNFQTADIINLTTSGTGPGYQVALFKATQTVDYSTFSGDVLSIGTPLVDSNGDGLIDTDVIQPGQSVSIIARVVPDSTAGSSDTTIVQAVSVLDQQTDPGNNTVRTVNLTTALSNPPAIASAVIDYGYLRSRNATLSGSIAAGLVGDAGPHEVRINWGDGKIDTVTLADGETNFSLPHRYKHSNKRPAVKITVLNTSTLLSSTTFVALTRSQATVIAAYQSALGRDPTAKELKKWSKKFDQCRSSTSYAKQEAKLIAKLKA